MLVAFVLPASMPLVVPIGSYRMNWLNPAMMILLGARYIPFVFLYRMKTFAVLAGVLHWKQNSYRFILVIEF